MRNTPFNRIDGVSFIARNGHFYGLILPEHVNLDTIKKWLDEIIEKRPELIDQVKGFNKFGLRYIQS